MYPTRAFPHFSQLSSVLTHRSSADITTFRLASERKVLSFQHTLRRRFDLKFLNAFEATATCFDRLRRSSMMRFELRFDKPSRLFRLRFDGCVV